MGRHEKRSIKVAENEQKRLLLEEKADVVRNFLEEQSKKPDDGDFLERISDEIGLPVRTYRPDHELTINGVDISIYVLHEHIVLMAEKNFRRIDNGLETIRKLVPEIEKVTSLEALREEEGNLTSYFPFQLTTEPE